MTQKCQEIIQKVGHQMLTIEEKIELNKKSAEHYALMYKKTRSNHDLKMCTKVMMKIIQLEESLQLTN